MIDLAVGTAELLERVLEEIHSLNPLEHRRIQRDLEAGGWLRLVVDRDVAAGPGLMRMRVRMVSSLGRNRWLWGQEVLIDERRSGRA